MSKHIYTVVIKHKDGAEETRQDLSILHDYEKSCQEAQRSMEFGQSVESVSVKNELGVTVFFQDRWARLCEIEGVRISADAMIQFLTKGAKAYGITSKDFTKRLNDIPNKKLEIISGRDIFVLNKP